jgi:hypothetical protein
MSGRHGDREPWWTKTKEVSSCCRASWEEEVTRKVWLLAGKERNDAPADRTQSS